MLTEILEMVSGCSTQIVGEGESPSVLIWKGESGRTHFCGPNRKSYFQYLSPLKLKTETYSASETRFFRRRIISTRSVTNIYFVRCAFSCTCWGGGWGEARRSQFSRFWIWKNFCKISWGGGFNPQQILYLQRRKEKNKKFKHEPTGIRTHNPHVRGSKHCKRLTHHMALSSWKLFCLKLPKILFE